MIFSNALTLRWYGCCYSITGCVAAGLLSRPPTGFPFPTPHTLKVHFASLTRLIPRLEQNDTETCSAGSSTGLNPRGRGLMDRVPILLQLKRLELIREHSSIMKMCATFTAVYLKLYLTPCLKKPFFVQLIKSWFKFLKKNKKHIQNNGIKSK